MMVWSVLIYGGIICFMKICSDHGLLFRTGEPRSLELNPIQRDRRFNEDLMLHVEKNLFILC